MAKEEMMTRESAGQGKREILGHKGRSALLSVPSLLAPVANLQCPFFLSEHGCPSG